MTELLGQAGIKSSLAQFSFRRKKTGRKIFHWPCKNTSPSAPTSFRVVPQNTAKSVPVAQTTQSNAEAN